MLDKNFKSYDLFTMKKLIDEINKNLNLLKFNFKLKN